MGIIYAELLKRCIEVADNMIKGNVKVLIHSSNIQNRLQLKFEVGPSLSKPDYQAPENLKEMFTSDKLMLRSKYKYSKSLELIILKAFSKIKNFERLKLNGSNNQDVNSRF